MEHTIIIAAEGQGQGVGRALIQAAEQHAKASGVGSLWAGVSAENPKGVSFHARHGYEEITRLPQVGFKFGRWMDLILMRKWLGDES
jgi:phosphinothricin acetyltransferase